MSRKKILNKTSIYLLLVVGLVLILFPTYLTIITAMKTPTESAENFFSLPKSFYMGNFKEVMARSHFFKYAWNSLLITGVSLVLIIFISPMISYAIARNLDKKYYKFLFVYITMGIFIPFQVIMIPVTKLMTKINMLNQGGLIILYITYSLIQSVFLYVGYIKTIPRDLEEAAYIDGCSIWQAYYKVIFPLLRPVTATVFIMNALWIWNDFLLPLLILNKSPKYWTLQLFQYNFKSQYMFDYNLAFSSFMMSSLPVIIVYLIMQKNIVSGLTCGAIKQ